MLRLRWIILGACVSLGAACVLDREGTLPLDEVTGGMGPGGGGQTTTLSGGNGGMAGGVEGPECGNGEVEGTESCDGADLAGRDCTDFAFSSPVGLVCNQDCSGFDTTGCSPTCDGALLEATEVCDGADLGGQDCTDYDYVTPAGLVCNATCDGWDPAGCMAACDNGAVEPTEPCDDGNADPVDGCHACALVDGTCATPFPVDLVLGGTTQVFVGNTKVSGAADSSTSSCGVAPAPDHVFAVTPDADGFLSAWIDPNNSEYDTILYARTDCVVDSQIRCSDNYSPGGETISFDVTANTTYYVVVDGFDADAAGQYELHLDLSAGTCADPVEFPVFAGGIGMCGGGSTTGETDERQTSGCGGTGAGDVVYRVITNFTGVYGVVLNNTYDGVLNIDSTCGTALTCDRRTGSEVVALNAVTSGDEIFAWADGFSGSEGRYELCVSPP